MARESLDVDILFVGAGPASLAGALHLRNLVETHNQDVESGKKTASKLSEISIAVIEKGAEIGSHAISGAVLDPRALKELIPDFVEQGTPFESPVVRDEFVFLTPRGKFKSPLMPPPLHNKGNYVASLGKVVKWMAKRAEQKGIDLFPGFPGVELLSEANQVIGVRTGDKGIDRHGKAKPNFEPGIDLHAKITILGEGPRGTLTKKLVESRNLDAGRNPQTYAIGVKELWKLPSGRFGKGHVIHTVGFPLDTKTFGGGFLYGMADDILDIGFVVGLDYEDPQLDPHREFQRFKTHPWLAKLLQGGQMISYGAKAIPEGGFYSVPEPCVGGCLIIGDSAGLLNAQRLKGIHLAMKSGMLAAETAFGALLHNDFGEERMASYGNKLQKSWVWEELRSVRNFHQAFEQGLWVAMFHAGVQYLTGGRGLKDNWKASAGHRRMQKLDQYYGTETPRPKYTDLKFDGILTFSKVDDVYYSATRHDEDQPSHLVIADYNVCNVRCRNEYGNPCQYFCPANVYEMVDKQDGKGVQLFLNASNCVHCKTCDIMDPYQIITWVPPEGGGGPQYENL